MTFSSMGTQLRHLIELLDGAVAASYLDAGLDYRPRYTPIVRALLQHEPASIGAIAEAANITQPAATQTVALMIKAGLLDAQPGPTDARQKMISLSARGRALLPQIHACWQATAGASASLEADLPYPLADLLGSAIKALSAKPMGTRIREARARLDLPAPAPAPTKKKAKK